MKLKLFFSAALICIAILFCASVGANDGGALVSPGLNILASRCDMAKASLKGDNIGFSQDDFERALNVSYIDSITVTSLPDASSGKLKLGSASLSAGQSIVGSNLSLLTFVPAGENSTSASFEFSLGDNGYSIKCNLFFLDELNHCPTVSLANESSLKISTHDEISVSGMLEAYDPEGDAFVFEIVSYPKNGSAILCDRVTGEYLYTPKDGYSGDDKFSYVARDIYGNYSSATSVSINVEKKTTSVVFGDIKDCNTYNAALTMVENSVMSGTDVQGVTYFSPEQSISRAEFVSTAMRAVGITDLGGASETVFADDDDIPGSMKGYVNTAYQLGFINGSEIDGKLCFLPDSTITRAEAAVVINNILSSRYEVEMPVILPVFADSTALPSWAKEAIYCMESVGIIKTVDGYASPEVMVTRGDAAQMLSSVINLYK